MDEKGPVTVNMGENLPLLNDSSDSPLATRCLRGIRCKRCVLGSHENTKKRIFLRRALFAMVLAYLYWYFLGAIHSHGFMTGGGDHDNSICQGRQLIPWDGPSKIITSATNLDVKVVKGNLAGSVKVLTADVAEPTIIIQANVSWNIDKSRGDHYKHGLHIEVLDTNNHMTLTLWADKDKNMENRENRFCGRYKIKVLLPKSFDRFGNLNIEGTLMDLDASELSRIVFESMQFRSVSGEIKVLDLVQTKELVVDVTSGPAAVERVTAPAGTPLDVRVNAVAGAIKLNADVPEINNEGDQEATGHKVVVSATSGAVDLTLQPAASAVGERQKNRAPGDIRLSASSTAGHVSTKVALAEDQTLYLDGNSVAGAIDAVVSDRFLGDLRLSNTFGQVSVKEAKNSKSVIDYTNNRSSVKEGKKRLSDRDQESKDGSITLSSVVGQVRLSFE